MTTENLSLVALSPADVPGQQAQLVAWCQEKVHAAQVERSDMLDNMKIAQEHGWRNVESLKRAAHRAERTAEYYKKIGAAAEAGYLIVPNFEVEVMAVRVKRKTALPGTHEESATSYRPSSIRVPDVHADVLAVGEGKYVDQRAAVYTRRWSEPVPDAKEPGTQRHHIAVTRSEYNEPDFPVLAVKPIVMDATARAMSLKLFDRIGVVTGRKEDPIVVGQIIDPRRGSSFGRPNKIVSFFIAWWLDTKAL